MIYYNNIILIFYITKIVFNFILSLKKIKNNVLFNKHMINNDLNNSDIIYYLESLQIANDNINKRKQNISLKDVVGFEF